jgi:hypothetical protein
MLSTRRTPVSSSGRVNDNRAKAKVTKEEDRDEAGPTKFKKSKTRIWLVLPV